MMRRVWPRGRACQAVRAAGEKGDDRGGDSGRGGGVEEVLDLEMAPVKYSAGPGVSRAGLFIGVGMFRVGGGEWGE